MLKKILKFIDSIIESWWRNPKGDNFLGIDWDEDNFNKKQNDKK